MLLHLIIGFILPWIVLGIYLVRKQKKLFIAHYTVSAFVSFLINDIGFVYFWKFNHFEAFTIIALPYNIGLFPILGSLYIYVIYLNKLPHIITFLLFVILTTMAELLMVLQNIIIYINGWNIAWTAVSYAIAYLAVYLYYKLVHSYLVNSEISTTV